MKRQAPVRIIVVALLALAAAPVAFAQNGGGSASAATVTPRIKTVMAGTRALQGSSINIDTVSEPRIVTLTGIVRSAAQKKLAEAIARQNAKGYRVQNRLIVRAEQPETQSRVPRKFKRTLEFLQLLGESQGRIDGTAFGQRKTRFADVKRVASFVSSHGVSIVDVNRNNGKPLFISRANMSRDLTQTGSRVFDSFAYVGYLFAMPSAQEESLTCKATQNGVVVETATGHRLTWEREQGLLQLRKLEYLLSEGN